MKRDPAFFLVTNMPGRKPPVKGEVSTIIGYPFKEGQPVKLTIDDASYDMFSKGDTAWVDTGSDKKIVGAMKAGKSLKVKGTSSTVKRGTLIKGIHLTDDPDLIECRVEKIKGLVLRTEFLKKV